MAQAPRQRSPRQIDFQTVVGKAPAGVPAAKPRGVPCMANAGSVGEDLGERDEVGIDAAFTLANFPMTLEESMAQAAPLVAKSTEHALRLCVAARRDARARRHLRRA